MKKLGSMFFVFIKWGEIYTSTFIENRINFADRCQSGYQQKLPLDILMKLPLIETTAILLTLHQSFL